jgi:hypothetical protein
MTPQFLLEVGNSDKTLARGSILQETLFKQEDSKRFNATENTIQGKLYKK